MSAGPNWSIALVGALAAVGLVAAVQLWPDGSAGPAKPTAATTTDGAITAAQRHSASPAPAAVVPATPSPSATAPVDVRIAARSAPSWLGITNSAGKQLFWNILQPGETQEFTDQDQLQVIVGDAGAVDITVNGHHMAPPPGSSGKVFHATYSAGSPQ